MEKIYLVLWAVFSFTVMNVTGDDESVPSNTSKCNLFSLDLSYAGINYIRPNFIKSEYVNELILEGNVIEIMSDEAFDSLPSLTVLDLSRNNLTTEKFFKFGVLSQILVLNLNENFLLGEDLIESGVRKLAIPRLDNLEDLYLRNVRITDLEEGWPLNVPNIRTLDLSENQINVTSIFKELPATVARLYIQDVGITTLPPPEGFFNNSWLKNIVYLYLDDNKFSRVTSSFLSPLPGDLNLYYKDIAHLKLLSLSNCGIKEVQSNAFVYAKSLQYLNLSRNYIRNLAEDLLQYQMDLKELTLSYNPLIGFLNLTAHKDLEYLDLSYIDSEFFNSVNMDLFTLPALKVLNLRGNRIKSFPENIFLKLPALTALDLADNRIKTLSIVSNPNILYLDVSSNPIKSFLDVNVTGLKALKELRIRNTSIEKFRSDSFANIPQTVEIYNQPEKSVRKKMIYNKI